MAELEREKVEILNRFAKAPAAIPDVHPNSGEIYRRNVERLAEALDDPDGGAGAGPAVKRDECMGGASACLTRFR